MEACATAQYWGRRCQPLALTPVLLPSQYVRAYVRRNKTDRTDAEALLEARRCAALCPVPVKTAAQQALQAVHRVRQGWQTARTARINMIRGLLREHGVALPRGAAVIRRRVPALLEDADAALPRLLCFAVQELLGELHDLETRLQELDRQLQHIADDEPVAQRLQTVPGVGVITATGLLASVPHIHSFARARQFASWIGGTPRESSSGHRRRLGHISKRGNVYLRTLLTHGARSVLLNAQRRVRAKRGPLPPLQQWAVDLASRRGHNTAVSALANKLARLVWAVWQSDQDYHADHRLQRLA